MTQRATKKYVSFGWSRGLGRIGSLVVAAGLALAVSACSSSDYVAPPVPTAARPVAAPVASAPAQTPLVSHSAGYGAPITGSDGYPNINVDTARPIGGQVRSVAEQDRLEAELLALGARQRVSGEGSTPSVMRDLQDLGRRARADAERQIESGAVPPNP